MRMNELLRYLKIAYHNVEGAEKIILNCALTAAGASAVGGLIPVLSIPAAIVSCVGAVWTMYISISKELGIPFKDNLLKSLASAALSNIAINLAGYLLTDLLLSFIPVAGVAANALLTFASVYLAGLMYMNMLAAFAKKNIVGEAIADVTPEDLEAELKQHTPTKDDVRDAKNAFKSNK